MNISLKSAELSIVKGFGIPSRQNFNKNAQRIWMPWPDIQMPPIPHAQNSQKLRNNLPNLHFILTVESSDLHNAITALSCYSLACMQMF